MPDLPDPKGYIRPLHDRLQGVAADAAALARAHNYPLPESFGEAIAIAGQYLRHWESDLRMQWLQNQAAASYEVNRRRR